MASTPPIPYLRLKQIASDACNNALGSADFYEHNKTEAWNTTIINTILKSLISETSNGTPPSFKYAVNSTIIQHLVPTSSFSKTRPNPSSTTTASTFTGSGESSIVPNEVKTEATSTDGKPHVGRRGMHSATGAYWNEKTDGMWSFKYEGGENKGLDVVVSVIWIGL